jgi:hypothetical protein
MTELKLNQCECNPILHDFRHTAARLLTSYKQILQAADKNIGQAFNVYILINTVLNNITAFRTYCNEILI